MIRIDPFLGLLSSPVGEDFGCCCFDMSSRTIDLSQFLLALASERRPGMGKA